MDKTGQRIGHADLLIRLCEISPSPRHDGGEPGTSERRSGGSGFRADRVRHSRTAEWAPSRIHAETADILL
jgi:hypothetical protein